jgi:hypothetical protein
MMIKGGYPYYGEAIGILLFDNRRYPMVPGVVGNASTYNFPVRLKVVEGLNWYPPPEDEWGESPPGEVELLVEAARELEREGVRAIVTGCGFFSVMQETLARAVNIPVFTSPLILLPLLLRTVAPTKSIAVYTASKPHLSEGFIRAGGLTDLNRIKVFGAENASEFTATHMGGTRTDLDIDLLQQQILDIAVEFTTDNPDVAMILLECSNFPCFSAAIQEETGLPVVDYVAMINFVFNSVVCHRYTGFT